MEKNDEYWRERFQNLIKEWREEHEGNHGSALLLSLAFDDKSLNFCAGDPLISVVSLMQYSNDNTEFATILINAALNVIKNKGLEQQTADALLYDIRKPQTIEEIRMKDKSKYMN